MSPRLYRWIINIMAIYGLWNLRRRLYRVAKEAPQRIGGGQ